MSSTCLYYIYDPMCSWCYAFRPAWQALQDNLPADMSVAYVVGGLAPDSNEPMPVEMRDKIQKIWRHIERVVPGTQFNHDFWELNTPRRSTYLACRAILAAKLQGSEFAVQMLAAIQTAYYQQAQNPSLESVLHACALEIGLDGDQFKQDVASDYIEQALRDDLKKARSLNGNSFPTLCLVQDNQQYPITVDYHHWERMQQQIASIL